MKKRILIFSTAYFPKFVGGAEVAIKEITDRLGGNFDFDMITVKLDKRHPSYEKIGNINVYRIGFGVPWISKVLMPITGFWKSLELSQNNNYAGIWSIIASYNSFAALFYKITHPNIPFILTLQEGDSISHIKKQARPVWPLFKLIFLKPTIIQVISNHLKGFALSMGATAAIEVIPNGVDIANFSKDINENELYDLMHQLEKKKDDIFLITTSRLVEKNGIEDLISSLVFLPNRVKLLVLGSGPLEKKLLDHARSKKVIQRVSFLGQIKQSELPKYLRISDIFVRPSLSEGFGNSFIEAMASGLPVIATKVGGIPDFISEGKTGLFAKVNDPASIAEQVELIIHDQNLYKKLIKSGYLLAKEKYDWSLIVKDMKDKVFKICL